MKMYFIKSILAKASAKGVLLIVVYLAAYSLHLSFNELSSKLKSFSALIKKVLRAL